MDMAHDQIELAELLQKECHTMVEFLVTQSESGKVTQQDATNVWLFQKLAELEIRIRKIEVKTNYATV